MLQQKVSYFGSTLLRVAQHALLISDPLQGVQAVSLADLTPIKGWKFPFLLEKQFITLNRNEDNRVCIMYPRQGVVTESKQDGTDVVEIPVGGNTAHLA